MRGALIPGTVVEVLVGHADEMEARGHEVHLEVHLGNSATGWDATC